MALAVFHHNHFTSSLLKDLSQNCRLQKLWEKKYPSRSQAIFEAVIDELLLKMQYIRQKWAWIIWFKEEWWKRSDTINTLRVFFCFRELWVAHGEQQWRFLGAGNARLWVLLPGPGCRAFAAKHPAGTCQQTQAIMEGPFDLQPTRNSCSSVS